MLFGIDNSSFPTATSLFMVDDADDVPALLDEFA